MGEENKICCLLLSDQSAGNRWTREKTMMQIPMVCLLGEDWEAINMYMSIDSS